jgi:hypothetical protein
LAQGGELALAPRQRRQRDCRRANANAAFANSTAIGQGAPTTRANQQMFGTASNGYTMAGINTAGTAAQVGPVKLVTGDGAGNECTHAAHDPRFSNYHS